MIIDAQWWCYTKCKKGGDTNLGLDLLHWRNKWAFSLCQDNNIITDTTDNDGKPGGKNVCRRKQMMAAFALLYNNLVFPKYFAWPYNYLSWRTKVMSSYIKWWNCRKVHKILLKLGVTIIYIIILAIWGVDSSDPMWQSRLCVLLDVCIFIITTLSDHSLSGHHK